MTSRRSWLKALVGSAFGTGMPLSAAWANTSGDEGVSSSRILIGQSITLRGGKDEYGTAVMSGIDAYLQQVNRRGGVNGRKIVLKTLDDEGKSSLAESHARQLVQQDKVFLLFGSLEGGPSTAVMKVAVEAGVPLFAPIAGSPGFRTPHQPLVFPVRAEHLEEFRALLGYARKTGITRVAFLRADTEVGKQHLANVTRLCAELGFQPPVDLPFLPEVTDQQLEQLLQRAQAGGAQVMFNHGSAGVYERLIRQALAAKARLSFYGVNSGSVQLVRHLGDATKGMVFSQVVPSPWERKNSLTREYQEVWAREKPGQDFSYGSLEGFMSAKALVLALKAGGTRLTRASLVQALESGDGLDLGDRLKAGYRPGEHKGLTTVDLAIVSGDLKFRH